MAFTCVPATATTKANHRMCNCRSCRNTGHDQRGTEFSHGAKTTTIGRTNGANVVATPSAGSAEDDESGDESVSLTSDYVNKKELFHQQNLVNLMLVLDKNQSNRKDNSNKNYVDSSQLPNDSNLTSDTTIENHLRVINDEVDDDGTNYETSTTHDSNNYLFLDHEFNTKNVKRVWKMQRSKRIFASFRVNTFLLIAVSTVFLLTISNGVNAGPINTTQVAEITTERVSI